MDYSDRWLERGDFFKLNTISLSYMAKPKGTLKTVFDSAKIYLTAQNLVCLTNFSGFDPDFTSGLFTPGNSPTAAFSYGAVSSNPVSFILGVNVSF